MDAADLAKSPIGFVLLNFAWRLYVALRIRLTGVRSRDAVFALEGTSPISHMNCALTRKEEVALAVRDLESLGAFVHHDKPKNWDLARALRFILSHGGTESSDLDMGCGRWGGMLLPSLARYGYGPLVGCDPIVSRDHRRGSIRYLKRDFVSSGLPSNSLGFITSLSVIEHGVSIEGYLKEAHRLLKPGGYLLTSTDYWYEPIDTAGIYPYGADLGEMKIFDAEGLAEVLSLSESIGFEAYDDMIFDTESRLACWAGRTYTFAFFVLRKH